MQEIEPFSSYGLGYIARIRNIPRDKNPFKVVGEMHGRWDKGWEHADDELTKTKAPVMHTEPTSSKVIPIKLVKQEA